ncbi:MAG: hypothetical protein GX896_02505 [Clostridiales bacterium]|nr:hypothetical protein [Clostridiales bacterium]
MDFILTTQNNCEKLEVYIDDVKCEFKESLKGNSFNKTLESGTHQIKVIKKSQEKPSIIMTWLSIFSSMSDFNLNDIKNANLNIEYSGIFNIEHNIETMLYISKKGITFSQPSIKAVQQDITKSKGSFIMFFAYILPLLIMLALVLGLLIFAFVNSIIKGDVFFAIVFSLIIFFFIGIGIYAMRRH